MDFRGHFTEKDQLEGNNELGCYRSEMKYVRMGHSSNKKKTK